MTRKIRILMLLCCLIPWMRAAADNIVTAVGSGSICPGDEVVVPVTVNHCDGVAAISLALNYDPTKVTYLGYQNLNNMVSTMLVNESNGTVYMSWAKMNAVDLGETTLLELRFKGIVGSTGLNWNTSLCEYSDTSGTTLPANYNNGSLNVYAIPVLTSSPVDRHLVENQSTNFDVGATGQGLSYQWQFKTPTGSRWQDLSNDAHHSNVNSWRLYVNQVTMEMDGNQYRCVVSGTCPSPVVSDPATLTVEVFIPTIVTSIGSASICPNTAFSVPVTVTNCNNVGAISLVLNYNADLVSYVGYEDAHEQLANGVLRVNAVAGKLYLSWASSNQALTIGDGTLLSFTFKSRSGNSSLSWDANSCEYANLSGGALPTAFNGNNLNIYFPPSITQQPADRTVKEGQNTNFSVRASGQGLSYQWQMSQDNGYSWETLSNGGPYSGVTGNTLYVNGASRDMDGLLYRCLIQGSCEPPVTSESAKLTVEVFIPTIVTTAGSLNTCSQNEFGIPISVTNCNNVGAISLAMSYNTDVLTYAGYEGLNPALGNGQLQVNAANGMVFIAWASVAGASIGDGNLITINFTALSGTSTMGWNTAYCEYANPQGVAYPTSYNNGRVTVGDMSFSITSQPSNHTVTMGENTTFAINTSGSTSGFQWQVSEDNGASWSNIVAGTHYATPNTKTLKVNNVALEMNGYRFRCVISGSCGVQYSSVAILTVQLPVNYYEIALSSEPEEGGSTEGAGAYEEGLPCTVTATPNVGYDFVSWTENGAVVSQDATYTFTVTNDRALEARFALHDYSITAVAIPAGNGRVEGAGTYHYGDHVLLTAIPNEGFVFDNWTEGGNVISTNQSISFNVENDRALEAHFSVMQLHITAIAEPAANGSVTGTGVFDYGTTVILTAIPIEGFGFGGWFENDTLVSSETVLTFEAHTDRSFVAQFVIRTLNITAEVDPEESGSITGTGVFNYGDPVVLTATPFGDFEFYNWTEDGEEVSTQPSVSFTAYQDRHLVAHFIRTISIAATAQPEGSGTVSGAGTYNYAEPVTLTAVPAAGYFFVNWTENGTVVSTEPSISFTAYESRTLVANFEAIMHHISVSANVAEGGVVSGGGDFQEGTRITVLAEPNEGFSFLRWTENGNSVSSNQEYSFTVTGDRDLVAVFELLFTDTVASACETFEWHGHQYTQTGVYYDTLQSQYESDSIVALHLTIHLSYNIDLYETSCGVYYWDDEAFAESGDYVRQYESVYGCDSIETLHLTVIPSRPLGAFGYMSPANNYIDRFTNMEFYWDAVANANRYDFYFWQGDGGRPEYPTLSNTTAHTYSVSGLSHGGVYHWCVVAKNECEEQQSEIRTMTCQLDPSMAVIPLGMINFGDVELGSSATRSISVSGVALTEDISYAFLDNTWGQDAPFFHVTPSNWSPTEGGMLHVTFEPEPTQLYYNAAIRIASGAFADTVYFMGSVANRYVFTTEVEGEVYSANDSIPIHGHVEDILGNAVADMPVTVYLTVMGLRQTITVLSDANGNYSTTYVPRYSESGYYQVGSCAYGDYTTAVHDSFDIPGIGLASNDLIVWTPYQDEMVAGVIEIRNRSRIPVSGIQVNTISVPSGCDVDISGVTELGPLETGLFYYYVTGTTVSQGNGYEEALFEFVTAEGVTMNMTCYYYCLPRQGALSVYPSSVSTTMQRSAQKVLSFQISNRGNGDTGPITVSLPNVPWMSMMGESTLPSMQAGDSCAFSILLAPSASLPLNQYNGSIAVNCANGSGFSIPYHLTAVADTSTTLIVDVTDDYTYNTNGGNGPHLAGANVSLTSYYSLEKVAEGMTDENGLFQVDNLPEGYYRLSISAKSHKGYEGVILVEAGQSTRESRREVYLQFQAITYSWVVVPTEIEDVYDFELVTEVATNVPVPVVTIEGPTSFDPLEYGDTLHFNMTVSNQGLVNALDVQINMPTEFDEYVFSSLYDHIDTLHANTSVVVPCSVTRVANRSDRSDECVTGSTRIRHYYYCNSMRRWVELFHTVHLNSTCPHQLTGDFNLTHFALGMGLIDWPYGNSGWETPGGGGGSGPGQLVPCAGCAPEEPSFWTDPVAVSPDGDCTPCWKIVTELLVSMIHSITGIDIQTLWSCVLYNFNFDEEFSLGRLAVCSANFGLCVLDNMIQDALADITIIGKILKAVDGIVSTAKNIRECLRIEDEYIERNDLPVTELLEQLEQISAVLEASTDLIGNLFGDEAWLEEPNLKPFLENFLSLVDTNNYSVSSQAMQQLIEVSDLENVSDEQIQSFVERWNRSILYWDAGYHTADALPEGNNPDFIEDKSNLLDVFNQVNEYSESHGFEDTEEMLNQTINGFNALVHEHDEDVCAKVTVSFKQRMTMTREAFEGTLRITNGHAVDPMQDIDVDIVIRDMDGVDRTDLFQINVKSLSQITGVDGTGSLDAQTEGTVMFEMIPTIAAAPETSVYYAFGGSFSFLDPFSGDVMTYPLFPVKLQVNPSPELHVDYFISRNIISDDPLTSDTIEATVPAELAMMIRNVGVGDAQNVYLQSSQPQIIENQNGLLIQFDMVGSAMNGVERPLGLTDIPFGTIASQTAGIAEWYFTSSLLARVIHSTPRVIHNNSYGNPKLSLVTELHSHDLIHAVRAYGDLEDGINDFLVNETVDLTHIPDMIYFSHGGTSPVSEVVQASTNGSPFVVNSEVSLTMTPTSAGWNYVCVDDPAQGQLELIACIRDDGQEIPLSNVWTTWATMLDEGAPIHENKLHLVDTLPSKQPVTYQLVYANDLFSKITVTVNPVNCGQVNGAGYYRVGDTVTLHAVPSFGYEFYSWSEGNNVVSNDTVFSFIAGANRNLRANFYLSTNTIQQIHLYEGWNWFSSYITYDESTMPYVADQIDDYASAALIKSQNSFSSLEHGDWTGTLTALENQDMYMIQVDHDLDFTLTGTIVRPSIFPITLFKGWTWVCYIANRMMSLDESFVSLSPVEGDLIKSQYGFSTYNAASGEWLGNLTTLKPGEGYAYLNNGMANQTLIYPNSGMRVVEEYTEERHFSYDWHRFMSNMTLMVTLDASEFDLGKGSHEIAAFVGDDCRGSARLQEVNGQYIAFVTVGGEDGEEVTFRLFDVNGGEVYPEVAQEKLRYATDAVFGSLKEPFKLHFRGTGLDETEAMLRVSPNPVYAHGEVRLGLSTTEKVRVEIYSALGVKVMSKETSDGRVVLSPAVVPGTYIMKVVSASGAGHYCKLIVE